MKPIQLELEVEETNTLLEALGQMPFIRVYKLIAKIQEQARGQAPHAEATEEPA